MNAGICELSDADLDNVSGGNPVLGFVLGWAATKILDKIYDEATGPSKGVKAAWENAIKQSYGPQHQ